MIKKQKELIKKEEKKEKILNNITLGFLFFTPFFSTTFLYSSYFTLIQVIIIFFIFIATLCIYKESRKKCKYLFLYFLVCFLYLMINYLRKDNFISLVPGNFNYSLFAEFLTVIKLITPSAFLYSLYYQKIDWQKYMLVFKIWVILISGSIIITNLFKISLGSYNNLIITKNIFEWNLNNYYQETASKGYFMYANQIAAITILLLLIFVYNFIKKNKKSIIYIMLLAISMLMLGTRVSSVGGLLTLICAFIFYIFLVRFKKEKFNKWSLALIIPITIWVIMLPLSPYSNRNIELNEVYLNKNNEDLLAINNTEEKNNFIESEKEEKINYVYNNYNDNYLPKIFFEKYYPIEYDYLFWYNFIKNTKLEDMNYRLIEISIIKRVTDINNNKLDILFGISNSRIQNIINIESDFILHYFAFGIIGSISLLLVYIIILGYNIYNFFKYQTYFLFITSTIVVLFIFVSVLTGNIINSINITIPTVFIFSTVFIGKKVDK